MKRRQIYKLLFGPPLSPDRQDKKVILLTLLLSSIFLLTLSLVVSTLFCLVDGTTLDRRYAVIAVSLVFVLFLYLKVRKGKVKSAAFWLLSVYLFIAAMIFSTTGPHNQRGILLAGFLIPLAGVLLGAHYVLIVTAINIFLVGGSYLLLPHARHLVTPKGVIMLCVMLGMIGIVSWMSNRQIQQAQKKAVRYQTALRKERDTLEEKVRERTKELETVQLDKLQQAHRFLELGYFSAVMLHDLANHLSSMSLDIAHLEGEKKSEVINRMKENVAHIESVVKLTRDHIRGEKQVETFDIQREIAWLGKSLRRLSEQHNVTIELAEPHPQPLLFTGNVVGFRQLLSNLVVNAVEAYAHSRKRDKRIIVHARAVNENIVITITDYGKGIPKDRQKHIFEPFYSTKKSGMGMGLHITKQLVETDLKGDITLTSSQRQGTTFTLRLPRSEKEL